MTNITGTITTSRCGRERLLSDFLQAVIPEKPTVHPRFYFETDGCYLELIVNCDTRYLLKVEVSDSSQVEQAAEQAAKQAAEHVTSTDHYEWADYFKEIVNESRGKLLGLSRDTMASWFANAIRAGRDEGVRMAEGQKSIQPSTAAQPTRYTFSGTVSAFSLDPDEFVKNHFNTGGYAISTKNDTQATTQPSTAYGPRGLAGCNEDEALKSQQFFDKKLAELSAQADVAANLRKGGK